MNEGDSARIGRQLIRFGLVGGFVTAVSAAVYYACAAWAGIAPLLANVLGYVVGGALGYVLHSRVSFRSHGARDGIARRTSRFATVSLITFVLNSAFVWVLTGLLHGPTWWPVVPMVFVTPLVAFGLNRQWVFG